MIVRFIWILAATFLVVACQIIEKNDTTIQSIEEKPVPMGSQIDIAAFNHGVVEHGASRAVDATVRITEEAVFQSSDDFLQDVSTPFSRLLGSPPHNPSIKLVLTDEEGKYRVFDSIEHGMRDGLLRRPLPIPPIRRHHLARFPLLNETEQSIWVGNLTASWHNEIPFDFLTNGYWMRLDKGSPPGSIVNAEIGAFVHGPKLAEEPDLPTRGTVMGSYRGFASGMYVSYYGNSWLPLDPRLVDGLKEVGEFTGIITLEVDFDEGTIRTCLGCVENQETTGITVTPEGNRGELYTNLSLASIRFAPVPIREGRFHGTEMEVYIGDEKLSDHLGVRVEFETLNNQGGWTGKFSKDLVSGTLSSKWVHPDDSRSVFLGSFFATEVKTN